MSGSIWVESEKGRGTAFTVEIPLMRAYHVDVETAPDIPVEEVSVEGLHVLIAEDLELNAEVLENFSSSLVSVDYCKSVCDL